jgi:hypothetical protein
MKSYLIFCVVLLGLSAFLYWKPAYNGDIGYYIAVAAQEKDMSDSSMISFSDSILKAEIPVESYRINRAILKRHSQGLLDYYRIKPLYIWFVRMAHSIGFSWSRATVVPSIVAFILLMLFTFRWLHRIFGSSALPVGILLMISYPILAPARMSTPDGLTALFLVPLFYLFVQNGSRLGMWILLSLLVSSRLDNMLPAGIFCIGAVFFGVRDNEKNAWHWMIVLLFLIGFGWVLNRWSTIDPFWALQVKDVLYKGHYLWQLGKAFRYFSGSYGWLFIVFGLVMVHLFKMVIPRRELAALVMIVGMILFRLLLFPAYEERFFGAYYIVTFIILLQILKRWKTQSV